MTLAAIALLVCGALIAWLVRPHLERTPPPTVAPPPKPLSVPPIRVEFRSGSGRRVLGVVSLPAGQRRPRLNWQTSEGMGVFQCDRQAPDGTWIYRRVGVERNG